MSKTNAATHEVAALEARLREALLERDHALLELAREREVSNALRLALETRGEAAPPQYPSSAGLGPPPLRYVLVDRANEVVKTWLKPLHGVAKRIAARGPGSKDGA